MRIAYAAPQKTWCPPLVLLRAPTAKERFCRSTYRCTLWRRLLIIRAGHRNAGKKCAQRRVCPAGRECTFEGVPFIKGEEVEVLQKLHICKFMRNFL